MARELPLPKRLITKLDWCHNGRGAGASRLQELAAAGR